LKYENLLCSKELEFKEKIDSLMVKISKQEEKLNIEKISKLVQVELEEKKFKSKKKNTLPM
jgi:hypothetical protein